MDAAALAKLNEARGNRQAVVSVTDIAGGGVRIVPEGEAVDGDLAAAIDKVFHSGRAGLVEVDGVRLFLNVYLPPPRIVVIGAVHISQALAKLAPVVGYDLMIIDPRTAFATEERFSGIDLVADWPEDVLKERPFDGYTAVAAVTHDPKIDDFALSEALKARCFYVGALGSRKTHAKRLDRLKEMGRSDGELARIRAPIGLDIGAASPEEIAIAIVAEIVQAFRRRTLVSHR